jgi:hypothetical protein
MQLPLHQRGTNGCHLVQSRDTDVSPAPAWQVVAILIET